MAIWQAAHLRSTARRAQPRKSRHRASVTQLQAARRVLGVVVTIELAVLTGRLLERVGFNHDVVIACMTVLAGDVLACWYFIARANHGRRQRR